MDKIETPFQKSISILSSRMLSALGAYHMWKWIEQARNTNNDGGIERATRNIDIFNRHLAVFGQIIKSTYKSFVIDLAFFFDKNYPDSLSMDKVLESAKDRLSDEDILNLKKEIVSIKQKHSKNINLIRELRNADVAHQEIEPKSRHILYENIEDLFTTVQEILNLVTSKYERSEHWWDHVDREMDRQMNWVVDNLERGEKMRLEEIELEYKELLK